MISREVFLGREGMQVRTASDFVYFCKDFDSKIEINYNGQIANCKSIISILALDIKENVPITIAAEGDHAEKELEILCNYLATWGEGELDATV